MKNEKSSLRVILMAVFFLAGLALVFAGWGMTGSLAGLGVMLVGLALLLTALLVYNHAFTDPKQKKKNSK